MSLNSASQYTILPVSAREDQRLGQLKEFVQDGEAYLKSQKSSMNSELAKEIISGSSGDRVPKSMSKVHVNMLKRDIRESVATLANMRPLWGYKTDNADFSKLAEILNKMLMSWYLGTFADRAIRQALQYAAVCRRGYVSPGWQNDMWIAGRGDIALSVYGPDAVIPYQIAKDKNLQKAYSVTIRDEVPFSRACATYPLQMDKLSPDRTSPTWMRKGIRRVQRFMSPVLQQFGQGQRSTSDETIFPTVDIYRTYTLDLSYNDTGKDIWMGEPGTKWYYKVPSIDSDIPTGIMDPTSGKMTYRKAEYQDAMLYPLRRLQVWTNQGILYDNTATSWHGKVPIVAFELDDWPWEFLGESMVADGESIQSSNTKLLRAIEDSANARLDPALAYDENSMSSALMERFNPRAPGQRVKMNMQMGEMAKPILTAEYYDVPQWIENHIEKKYEWMHYLLGTRDIQAIAKAKQVPAGDTLEKLMELAGPILTDMSRNMERSMRDLGEMWKGEAMQNYDLARRVTLLGKDGMTEEDWDYDPTNMIPSHLPYEMELIKQKRMREDAPSAASIIERAKAHLNSCYFHVTPNSLHQITQLTRKLMYMQLWKTKDFPLDPWTMAEVLDIPNFGTAQALAKILETDVPTDVFGRWLAWMELKSKLAQAMGGQPGRKPSGQQAPQIRQKDGGTRSTVTESPR